MKTWVVIAALVLLAWALYPRKAALVQAGQAGQAGRTEIVYWTLSTADDAQKAEVAEFERENPQYHVRLGTASAQAQDPTRFLLGVASGTAPDVIFFDRFLVVQWAARGAFVDLNPFLAADKHRADGVHAASFYAPMFDEANYRGHQYAIPNGTDDRALYMNDDLLLRAGFTNPDGTVRPPRTWEEMCGRKFDGSATISGQGVRLGAPAIMPGVGPVPVTGGRPVAGDVIVLRSGRQIFRARIAAVDADGTIHIDFSRELPPDVHAIPAGLAGDPNLQAKVFDGRSYVIATTHYNEHGDIDIVGFTPMSGNAWLYIYGWENGATFMSPDDKTCLLDQPQVKLALQYVVDCYDALGGYDRVHRFEDAQKGSPLDPLLAGKVAMRIDGNWVIEQIARQKPDFRFTLAPAPMPAARLKAGHEPISWVGGFAYGIPTGCKHPEAAWALIRFLSSKKAGELSDEVNAGIIRSQGSVYIPEMPVLKSLAPWQRERYLTNNPAITPVMLSAYNVMVSLLPRSKSRPVTPVGETLWEGQSTATDDAITHDKPVYAALTDQTRWVQENLDRELRPVTGRRVNWDWFIGGYAMLLLAGAGVLAIVEIRHRRAGLGRRNWRAGFVGVSPWLIGFIVLGGGPILFSLIISFCHYDVLHPARLAGLANYTQLLGFHHDHYTGRVVANDPDFWTALGNTAFMVIGVPVSIVLGLLLAMLLAHEVRGIGFFRTMFYLPSIVPAVATFLLWMWIFDPTRGLLNQALSAAGDAHPPAWLSGAAWAKPALIIMGMWGVGGGMLIWLAGLKSIPTQLYEAAEIDGAGSIRQFFHVTLPMISPYIFFNCIMGLIGTLQVFESAFIMTNGGPQKSTLFYAYYLFNQAFRQLNMGAASAMAWILFLVVIALTGAQAWFARKWVHYE